MTRGRIARAGLALLPPASLGTCCRATCSSATVARRYGHDAAATWISHASLERRGHELTVPWPSRPCVNGTRTSSAYSSTSSANSTAAQRRRQRRQRGVLRERRLRHGVRPYDPGRHDHWRQRTCARKPTLSSTATSRGTHTTALFGRARTDFRRVALHEFGHVLGLNHPDENGQNVSAS